MLPPRANRQQIELAYTNPPDRHIFFMIEPGIVEIGSQQDRNLRLNCGVRLPSNLPKRDDFCDSRKILEDIDGKSVGRHVAERERSGRYKPLTVGWRIPKALDAAENKLPRLGRIADRRRADEEYYRGMTTTEVDRGWSVDFCSNLARAGKGRWRRLSPILRREPELVNLD